jgi:hypothetical protein
MGAGKNDQEKSMRRAKVPRRVKRGILDFAGGKCANPGCPSRLTNFHHIDEWHIYQTHDPNRMVPLCPTCHSHVHQKDGIPVSGKETEVWKAIQRASDSAARVSHLYAEPGPDASLILGTLRFTTSNDRLLLLYLSERNQLSFRIINGSILLLGLAMSNPRGGQLLAVSESHGLTSDDPAVKCESRPGRVRVTTPATTEYLDAATLAACQDPEAGLVTDGMLTLADMQVVAPATVKITGVWSESGMGVIAAKDWLLFRRSGGVAFSKIAGYHEERGDLFGGDGAVPHYPVIRFEGTVNVAVLDEVFHLKR